MSKVALITGGASGMGLAVATALSKRGNWSLHLLDMNEERGAEAAKSVNGKFHKVNVTSYQELASTFDSIFKAESRLDFVFANAGIVERWDFYGKNEVSPPPEPDQLSIDIDLKSVVSTTYLAQHYFRISKPSYGTGEQSLIMTASCGGFYPAPFCPMYCAAKHGVVGLTRSVAKHFYLKDKIRVNAICPGTVRTNLMEAAAWKAFPDSNFTPVEKIVEVVLLLIDGGEMKDSKGVVSPKGKDWQKTVEVNGTNHYFREQIDYCDQAMADVVKATDVADNGKGDFYNPA